VRSSPAQPELAFVNATERSGLHLRHQAGPVLNDIRQVMAPGLCLADFNGDQRVDLFAISSAAEGGSAAHGRHAVYLNRGDMTFQAGPPIGAGDGAAPPPGMGCLAADYDGDGDTDVYVTALGANSLYRNDGQARFEDVAAAAGVDDGRWSTGAAFADYDLDGDLDLYVSNYLRFEAQRVSAARGVRFDRDEPAAFSPYVFAHEPDALYRNDGGGIFRDATGPAGVSDTDGKGMAVLFADLNADRLPDLLVINDVSRNAFFLNDGDGTFTDTGAISGLADPRSGMGVALGDYDGDGLFDLFSTHWQDESNVLYRSLGNQGAQGVPIFEDVTVQAKLAAPSIGRTGWGTAWGDFDHDGDVDLVVVNGYTSPAASEPSQCIPQPAMLFINSGGRFSEHGRDLGLAELARWAARGAGCADLDDDGDLDLVVSTNNGPLLAFENRLAAGHWIKVRPEGGQVLGTTVRVQAGAHTQVRMIHAGSSYLCTEPPIAHFGLGPATRVEKVEVLWPDGTVDGLDNVAANVTITISRSERPDS
jgi:hypothetical protein